MNKFITNKTFANLKKVHHSVVLSSLNIALKAKLVRVCG